MLVPVALTKAITDRLKEQNNRTGKQQVFSGSIEDILQDVTEPMKHDVQAQLLKRRVPFTKDLKRHLDDATITSRLLAEFDDKWKNLSARLNIVPGKSVLSAVNKHLQENHGVSITPIAIIDAMDRSEVPEEIVLIVGSLDNFAKMTVPV